MTEFNLSDKRQESFLQGDIDIYFEEDVKEFIKKDTEILFEELSGTGKKNLDILYRILKKRDKLAGDKLTKWLNWI